MEKVTARQLAQLLSLHEGLGADNTALMLSHGSGLLVHNSEQVRFMPRRAILDHTHGVHVGLG